MAADAVQASLNGRFTYRADKGESWRIMGGDGPVVGDCEDYSLPLVWLYEGRSMWRFWGAVGTSQNMPWGRPWGGLRGAVRSAQDLMNRVGGAFHLGRHSPLGPRGVGWCSAGGGDGHRGDWQGKDGGGGGAAFGADG